MGTKSDNTGIALGLPPRPLILEGRIRVGSLMGIPQTLQELGVDPAEVMASVGLDLSLFNDPENTMPVSTLGRLVSQCVARTNCPHFGLLVGQQLGLASLGLVGFLMQHSPQVGAALRSLSLYLHLHDRGAVVTLSVAHHRAATLSYAIYQRDVEGADQIYDGAIAHAFNLLRALCGSTWLPTEVLFSHRQPSDVGPYRRFFQAPLRFDSEQTALVFPARWLEQPLAGADPHLHRFLEQQIAAHDRREYGNLVDQLRRVLRTLLVTHQSSLEQVAQLFSLHRRTLNRRLQAQGTTYQALVDEVRCEIARQLLENTGLSMSQIAATLDYADPSAFSRAFRRWMGVPPRTFRRQRTQG